MIFEHLVEINDPNNPMLTTLTPAQVWRGLMWRAEKPQDFQEDITELEIIEQGDDFLVREFALGKLNIRDHIEWDTGREIIYDTQPNDQHGGGVLTMRLEQPEPLHLFVRFIYRTSLPETATPGSEAAEDAYYASYVKSAYQEADIDTVRRIRELAAAGLLGKD
ncbi:SRPBCC family protein [Amantichitinum ursilacus]|uniref:DUF1857 domain-containing protein n=1 Tax=Amantichitinum ursilacus TaxID=857265 RepID=A0A0N0GLG8_9NEIS|nr:SRPBCC family protein [Amantichitinum ursilacus]KPC49967.1 hypothetical protein WG78_18965 [Amantichitinum ursilacus]